MPEKRKKSEIPVKKYLKGIIKNVKGEFGTVDKDNLRKAMTILKENGVYRLVIITGMDTGDSIEALYHLRISNDMFTIKVPLDHKKPQVETISDLFPSAFLYERELMEMLGVEVLNHPHPTRLFLPDDWTEGPPLRKDVLAKLMEAKK